MTTENLCGTCTKCCKLMGVKGPTRTGIIAPHASHDLDVNKPPGKWCFWCDVGTGCSIYEHRPKACDDFKCYWLHSQSSDDAKVRMPADFRPDRSRVIIVDHDLNKVVVRVDPSEPFAFLKQPIWTFLYMRAQSGAAVYVIAGKRIFKVNAPSEMTKQFHELPASEIIIDGDEVKVRV